MQDAELAWLIVHKSMWQCLTCLGKFLNIVKPATKVVQILVPRNVPNASKCTNPRALLDK